MRFGWKKTFVFSLLPALALFGGLEGLARVNEVWNPPLPADYGWGFNPDSRLYVPASEPGLMMTHPDKLSNFHYSEFRVPKPDERVRIFMLGGSSVKYLRWRLERMALRLGQKMDGKTVEVLDAGGLTYGSHRLVPICAEVLGYDPDLILIYSAHNEFEELQQLELAKPERVLVQRWLYSSAAMRFLRDRFALARLNRVERERNAEILANPDPNVTIGAAWQHKFTPGEIAERMEKFEHNLRLMIEMCRDAGVPVIIGSVPSNYVHPELRDEDRPLYQEVTKLFDAGKYADAYAAGKAFLSNVVRHQSSPEENAIIRSLATEYGVPLADVEAAVEAAEPHGVPGETLFSDGCHLNDPGMDILIGVYEREVEELLGL